MAMGKLGQLLLMAALLFMLLLIVFMFTTKDMKTGPLKKERETRREPDVDTDKNAGQERWRDDVNDTPVSETSNSPEESRTDVGTAPERNRDERPETRGGESETRKKARQAESDGNYYPDLFSEIDLEPVIETSPYTREFYADYNRIEHLPMERRVEILKPLLEDGRIDKERYQELLYLTPKEDAPEPKPAQASTTEPEPEQKKKAGQQPASEQDYEYTMGNDLAEFGMSDFDSDYFGDL